LQIVQNNNLVTLSGKIISDFTFSHKVYDESFFNFTLSIPRLSAAADEIIVTVAEQLLFGKDIKPQDEIAVNGQFRSYNNYSNVGNKLILTVFAKEVLPFSENYTAEPIYENEINLSGFVCKLPVYRTTPFGREISDLLIAVNRTYNKSDYIPCIAWGRNAKYAGTLKVGDKVEINGRIQSRNYQKKTENEEIITKVAYEVSISKIAPAEAE